MDISLVCHQCGETLEEARPHWPKVGEVYVRPCTNCIVEADKSGYTRGVDEGSSQGYDDGHMAGVASVRDDVKEMLRVVKEESCAADNH